MSCENDNLEEKSKSELRQAMAEHYRELVEEGMDPDGNSTSEDSELLAIEAQAPMVLRIAEVYRSKFGEDILEEFQGTDISYYKWT